MFALIDGSGNFARVLGDDRVEWGGAYHSSVSLMLPSERKSFRIYDLVDAPVVVGTNQVESDAFFAIDHEKGIVTRTINARFLTADEIESREMAKASADLTASDAGTVRVVEDLVEVLIAKGVIAKADLPEAARKKLDDRKALRAALA